MSWQFIILQRREDKQESKHYTQKKDLRKIVVKASLSDKQARKKKSQNHQQNRHNFKSVRK